MKITGGVMIAGIDRLTFRPPQANSLREILSLRLISHRAGAKSINAL